MYITNMTYFLNQKGNIPKNTTKEERELASFMALVVDESTKEKSSAVILADIRCFKKKCEGTIKSEFLSITDQIH